MLPILVTETGPDLLARPGVARLLRSRWYPGILQWPATALFVLVVYQLLIGPDSAHDNLGTALTWVLWWPILPIVFVVLGRFWCTVCPFGKISDLVQRLVGVHRPVPRFLKMYGIWIIDAQFVLITWGDHVWGIVGSPWGTGVLLLLLTTAVVVSGAFFQRRTFCRYLCFLGGLSGNYARTGMVALRANPAICATCTDRAACYNGTERAPACPLFEFPRTMDSNANCNLCANCLKNCPNDAITLTARPPTRELWFVRTPKLEASVLAVAIMGIVYIQNLTMLEVWTAVLDRISAATGLTSRVVVFTIAFTIAIAVPVSLLAAASAIAARRNGGTLVHNFALFGFAIIPLDVAGHIAHNLFHLLAEGGSVFYTALSTLGYQTGGSPPALASPATIQVLQYLLIAVGVAGSLFAAYRIARYHYRDPATMRASLTPYTVVILAFALINVALFLFPMAHRV